MGGKGWEGKGVWEVGEMESRCGKSEKCRAMRMGRREGVGMEGGVWAAGVDTGDQPGHAPLHIASRGVT